MKTLNIAHLHWGFPPIIGGVETHLNMLLPEMIKHGHRVSLLTSSVEGVKIEYKYKGVDIYRSPLMDLNWLYKRGIAGLENDLTDLFSEFCKTAKPDIIHVHNMHYFSRPHARILEEVTQKNDIPLVLTAHNVWDDILFIELTTKVNWTHIIAVSHYIKRELIGVGCDDKKITVVHHGIDTREYNPDINTDAVLSKYSQLKNKVILFHPARMGLAKGCDVSIKALKIIRDKFPDIILVMAGTKNIIDWGSTQQKDIAYLLNLVHIFDLENNVLMDVFSLEEMAQIYALTKVTLYPSTASEPFGLTMLESLSSAKPVIVTESGGMPEIIQDRINGFVIPTRNFEILASRITELLTNDSLRERLGNTGRQIVEAHYTKKIVTRNTLDIYHKLIQD